MVKPPKYAIQNAKKSLECINKGSKAMTEVGRKRAKQLAEGKPLSPKDLKKIASFVRHKDNAKYEGKLCKDKGAVAWLGWGYGFKKGKPTSRLSKWAKTKLR